MDNNTRIDRCLRDLTKELHGNIIREKFEAREETNMKNVMFAANQSYAAVLSYVGVTASSCYSSENDTARAAKAVCAVFFAIAGAVISTSICAAMIGIIIPIIIMPISIIAIIQQLNMVFFFVGKCLV